MDVPTLPARPRLLCFGAGVIGSLYSARLALRGHDVTVVERGRRLRELRDRGIVIEDARRERRDCVRVTVIDEVVPADRYDLALVAVRKTQLAGAIAASGLRARVRAAPHRCRKAEGRLVMNRRIALVLLLAIGVGLAVAAASSAAPAKTRVVSIYAPRGASADCARVLPLRRVVTSPAVLKGSINALLAGPTAAERSRGYGGWFSAKTAGRLRSVRVSGGVAYVDFRNFAHAIPNASSSCGSATLLAQLDRTAKQFATVKRAVYSFDGSRKAFYEWLQLEAPGV